MSKAYTFVLVGPILLFKLCSDSERAIAAHEWQDAPWLRLVTVSMGIEPE